MSKPTFLDPLIGKAAGQTELVSPDRGTVLATHVEPAFDSRSRKKGLLGRGSIPDGYALVIAPCSAVHTFSMRVPIDAVFVSRSGRITKTCRAVKPWRLAGSLGAFAVIEAAPGFIDKHELLPGESVAIREIPNRRRATDTLPPLAGAAPERAAGSLLRHTAGPRRITLADAVSAREPLMWFESIAIVQELCERVIARGPSDDLRVPELKHIELTAEGKVALLSDGPSHHSAVQRAGLVVLSLTPEGQLPVQLRLLILEEVSPKPRLQSLAELQRELEYFERPDRTAIVQGVYDRLQRQFAPAAAESVPPPLLEPPPPRGSRRWWRHQGLWTGAAIVAATALIGTALWAWPRPEGAWLRNGTSRSYQAIKRAGGQAYEGARKEVDAFKWRVGLGRRATVPEVALQVVPPASPSTGAANQPGIAVAPVDNAGAAGLAPQLPPIQLRQAPLTEPAAPGTAAPVSALPQTPGADTSLTPQNIYSAADKTVTPPRLLSFAPAGSQSLAGSNGAQVEVTISASGEVESVRLVSEGAGTLSGMQLSAVKAWRFTPATLDGKAVRYRQRLVLRER